MTNETHSITPIIDLNNEIQTTNETNSTIESTPDDSALIRLFYSLFLT